MAEETNRQIRVGDWCPDIDQIIDEKGTIKRVDKDAIITLPTPEEIQRAGAVIINIPTLP